MTSVARAVALAVACAAIPCSGCPEQPSGQRSQPAPDPEKQPPKGSSPQDAKAGPPVRSDGTIYDVPLDIGLKFAEDDPLRVEEVRINAQAHTFEFESSREPIDVVLDPDTWLLMRSQFEQQ